MWFPTAAKLDDAVKVLMTRVGDVHVGMEELIRDDSILDTVLGPPLEYRQFQSGGEKIMEALLNLLTGLRSAKASVSEVNARIGNATAMVQRHEELFDAIKAARQSGVDAVDKFFESKNA